MLNHFKIVVVENPFENWKHALVPELFKQTIGLKRLGYEGYYPDGFLPVDTGDFVATHHLICEDRNSHLKVIAGYRSITLEKCKRYGLPFPGIALLDHDPGTDLHKIAASKIIEDAERNQKSLSYGSGFTVHPCFKGNREMAELLKDVTRAMMVSYQTDQKIDSEMGLSVPKVKTDRYFNDLGYENVSLNGVVLPAFQHAPIGNAPIFLINRKQFTPYGFSTVEKYRDLLRNALYINSHSISEKQAA